MAETTALTDRDLDAWLAEHLFGCRDAYYEQRPLLNGSEGEYAVCRCADAAHAEYINMSPNEYYGWEELGPYRFVMRDYSSTGDGMLLVIGAMRERGWWGDVELGQSGFMVAFRLGDAFSGFVKRDSLPRAVAEAAKAAIEAEA